jgi:hypothetical protein
VTHPLLRALASADAEQRRRACHEAEHDPSAVLLAPALAGALADPARAVVRAAAQTLVALGRHHPAVRETLREALRATAPRARIQAALALARLEPAEPRSLPALVAALDEPDGDLRWAATQVLVQMGRSHGEVLPVLLALAREGSPRARCMALAGLRELAPGEPGVEKALLAASGDPQATVRRAAYAALSALEPPPASARARLAEAVASDPDAASRRLAEAALAALRRSQTYSSR